MSQTTKRKPSPGPWTVSVNRSQGTFSIWDEYGNYHETESADMDANAQLIAAAPDLLEALHAVLFFVPLGTNARKMADSAIDKAEGWSE